MIQWKIVDGVALYLKKGGEDLDIQDAATKTLLCLLLDNKKIFGEYLPTILRCLPQDWTTHMASQISFLHSVICTHLTAKQLKPDTVIFLKKVEAFIFEYEIEFMYGEWASDLAELGYYDHLTDIERLANAY